MDEKVIRSAVPIIPAVLLIGCILAAFAAVPVVSVNACGQRVDSV